MHENNVSDLMTDQEIAFAYLVLSGKMTDREAAEAVGLNPDTAAYTKSKPRVRAWMLEHRAANEQQLVEQDTQELRRFNVSRDQVLARLWDIANLEPERTRNSMSAQVKAISMIVAIEGLIPDRRAVSVQNQPAPPPVNPPFYVAEWLRTQQNGENVDPEPSPAPEREEAQQEAAPNPTPNLSESTFPGPLDASQTTSSPHPSRSSWVPDTMAPFSITENPFGRRR
jgi:hypothetical protein